MWTGQDGILWDISDLFWTLVAPQSPYMKAILSLFIAVVPGRQHSKSKSIAWTSACIIFDNVPLSQTKLTVKARVSV